MDYATKSLQLHKKCNWKFEITSKIKIKVKKDFSTAYTPGVAVPCMAIAKDKTLADKLTIKGNTIAVISDWSAVLWLGNIWSEVALPCNGMKMYFI